MSIYEIYKNVLTFVDEVADTINTMDEAYVEDIQSDRLKLNYPDNILFEAFRKQMLMKLEKNKYETK